MFLNQSSVHDRLHLPLYILSIEEWILFRRTDMGQQHGSVKNYPQHLACLAKLGNPMESGAATPTALMLHFLANHQNQVTVEFCTS
ncbi:hypothetical protein SLE2022_260160 [Rubroshorea leprosula]